MTGQRIYQLFCCSRDTIIFLFKVIILMIGVVADRCYCLCFNSLFIKSVIALEINVWSGMGTVIIHSAKQSPSLMVHTTSLLLPRHSLKNMRLFSVFGGIHGLTIGRQPNERTVAFAGSNVTFNWNFILTPSKERNEELKVWFGIWNNNYNSIGVYLKKCIGINGLIHVTGMTENKQKPKRWHWNGDIS